MDAKKKYVIVLEVNCSIAIIKDFAQANSSQVPALGFEIFIPIQHCFNRRTAATPNA